MPPYRAMLSILVAVAIVVAPMAAAWAGGVMGMEVALSQTAPHTAAHTIEVAGGQGKGPMDHCASMMKGAADTNGCPHCDKDRACPPQFCMAKCFQILGLAQQLRPVARLVTAMHRPATPARPSDWSDQPQPPPPRT